MEGVSEADPTACLPKDADGEVVASELVTRCGQFLQQFLRAIAERSEERHGSNHRSVIPLLERILRRDRLEEAVTAVYGEVGSE